MERRKRQNGGGFCTTPENEKLPGYIWNNLSSGKEKKKWKESDPDSRRKICAGLSPEAPSDPSFQVASTTVAIHEIHAALHDFGSSEESSEVEVSDSENTTDPDHDLQVNQARANGQASCNGRKYDNAP